MNRREVLEKLARKEISKEEAERLLGQSGAPIADEPPAPPQKKNGMNRGCLITLIVGLVALPIVLVLLAGLFLVNTRSERSFASSNEQIKHGLRREIRKIEFARPEVPRSEARMFVSVEGGTIAVSKSDGEIIMDKTKELEERIAHIRKMEKEKKITSEEAERLIQAIKDSMAKEDKK